MKMVYLQLKLLKWSSLTLEQLCWIFCPACQPCPSFGNSCATAAEASWLMTQHSKLKLTPISDYLGSQAVICSGLAAAT